jgi:hypothetical protein
VVEINSEVIKMEGENKVYDLLVREYDIVFKEILARTEDIVKIVGYGLTILTVGFTVALSYKVESILLFLPLAYFGILYYYVNTIANVLLLRGYKKYIAQLLNDQVGNSILVWEPIFEKHIKGNFTRRVLDSLFFVSVLASIAFSIYTARTSYSDLVFIATMVFNVGLFVLLLGLTKIAYGRFDLGYNEAKKINKENKNK